jgi:glycosyltransferase involved in cell wall biosynthesis
MQLSIVIPCLNEIETIEICINKCFQSIKKMNIEAEVILADNGSTDGSIELAKKIGARVVHIASKGYGNALRGGIQHAKGKYIIMADSDDSYNFLCSDLFYNKLIEGYDMVQGCRFPVGGGKIEDAAMPFSHKYFGNPFFSFLSKLFFSLPFNDVYCGFRGFNREKFLKLNHFSSGMVFAIENLIKFKVSGAKCTEIPVTLHKDGRKNNKSHLNTISDGWTTLRFLMITCPKWLFFFPAIIFLILSFVSTYDLSNLINGEISILLFERISATIVYFLLGFQFFMFGLFSSLIAVKLQMLKSKNINNFFKIFKIRYAFLVSLLLIILILTDNYFFDIFFVSEYVKKILYYFGIFFSILLLINSLFISLITIDEQK